MSQSHYRRLSQSTTELPKSCWSTGTTSNRYAMYPTGTGKQLEIFSMDASSLTMGLLKPAPVETWKTMLCLLAWHGIQNIVERAPQMLPPRTPVPFPTSPHPQRPHHCPATAFISDNVAFFFCQYWVHHLIGACPTLALPAHQVQYHKTLYGAFTALSASTRAQHWCQFRTGP